MTLRGFALRTRGCGSYWRRVMLGLRSSSHGWRRPGSRWRSSRAGRGPGREGGEELAELLGAAVVGRAGKPAPKSLRAKSERKPGRPKGQPAMTMQFSDRPEPVAQHEPSCCSACSASLAGTPEAGVVRRQVTEVAEARVEATEHQIAGRRRGCGTVTWAGAPDGVTAPVQYEPRAAAIAAYLWHVQFLSRDRTCSRWRTCSAAPRPRARWPR